MLIGWLLALGLLVPTGLVIEQEINRYQVSQLQFGEVNFYPIEDAKSITELKGLEVVNEFELTESEFGTTVKIQVLNHGLLVGKREVWAKVYSPEGKLREGMKIWLELDANGPSYLEFFFTGTATEFRESKLALGF